MDNKNQYITKDYFKKELQKELQKETTALRSDLMREIKSLSNQIAGIISYIDKKFEAQDKRFDKHDKKFEAHDKKFSDLTVFMDEVMGEIKANQEERILMGHQNSRTTQRVENLEIKVFGKIQTA